MDTMITVAGNLTADPTQRVTANGAIVVQLRLASSSRRFDREAQEWRDGEVMFINVTCWRQLAGNVMATLRKGDGVVVLGRLGSRVYDDKQGVRRSVHEIEAVSVGPDLTRWPATIRRPHRSEDYAPMALSGAAAGAEQTPGAPGISGGNADPAGGNSDTAGGHTDPAGGNAEPAGDHPNGRPRPQPKAREVAA